VNWFSELYDLYDKNQDRVGKVEYKSRKGKKGEEQIPIVLLPVFHTTVEAQITVDLDETGNFLGAQTVPDEEKMTIIPVTETSGSRTGTKAYLKTHPLCDYLKYLAGDYMQYVKPEKKDFRKSYQLYMEGLEAWHSSDYTHEKVDVIYTYLKKGMLIFDLVKNGVLILDEEGKFSEKEKIQAFPQSDAFVRFRIIQKMDANQNILNDETGKLCMECWLDRSLHDSYIRYYQSILAEHDICYLTGEEVPISYLQPKKIRNEGDRSKLISSNDESNYTFRGRFVDKQEAFAIGYEASQKAHNALKWIIRKQGHHWDSLCIVIWRSDLEKDLEKVPEWSADTDSICDDYEGWGEEIGITEENTYKGTGEVSAARFRAAMQGYGENLRLGSKVILLSFDAAITGRLAMTENKEFESSRYVENIQYWHESCQWLHSKYKAGHNFTYMGMAGVKDIAEALYGIEQKGMLSLGGKSKMYAEVCKRLLPCISEKKKIPQDMVNLAVRKASSPVSYEKRYNWEKVLSIACSLIKKQKKEMEMEEWKLEVNNLSKKRDYLYGRLLAVADWIEYSTYDKEKDVKRVTNARRYMNALSQHPYQTWKNLEEQIQPYIQKLDIPERNTYNKLLDEIYHLFKAEDFIKNDRLEGLYLLGYHSQSYALRYKKEENQEERNDD